MSKVKAGGGGGGCNPLNPTPGSASSNAETNSTQRPLAFRWKVGLTNHYTAMPLIVLTQKM